MHSEHPSWGRVLSRREALSLLGGAGVMLLTRSPGAPAQPLDCIARPQQTKGPFFVDTGLERSDIRSDPTTGNLEPGVPLSLTFIVSRLDAGTCRPISGAHVELWQCNARGVYSGVRDGASDAAARKFLRGYQRTDAGGLARFTTIYPGWYPGRTVHLHFMVRSLGSRSQPEAFTSQLYFDDALSDTILATAPYAERGRRSVRNAGDGIYRRGGSQLMLAPRPTGKELEASFNIGLQGAS